MARVRYVKDSFDDFIDDSFDDFIDDSFDDFTDNFLMIFFMTFRFKNQFCLGCFGIASHWSRAYRHLECHRQFEFD